MMSTWEVQSAKNASNDSGNIVLHMASDSVFGHTSIVISKGTTLLSFPVSFDDEDEERLDKEIDVARFPMSRSALAAFLCCILLFCVFVMLLLARCVISSYELFNGKARMTGKTVVITGTTAGIGKAAATEFAKRGATVVMGSRDSDSGHRLVKVIRRQTKNMDVHFEHLDLASLNSVRAFVKAFYIQFSQPDVIVNNAAYLGPRYDTEDGFDRTFQVNHLSHFLLTVLLMRERKSAKEPLRVISMISDDCLSGDLMNPMMEIAPTKYSVDQAYANSKLANMMFVEELTKRYPANHLLSFAVHPGLCRTKLLRYYPGTFGTFLRGWSRLMYKSPKGGAQGILHCAIEENMEKHNGRLFTDFTPVDLPHGKRRELFGKRLWNRCLELCDLA